MKNCSESAINKLFFLNPANQLWAASLRRTLVPFVIMATFIMQLKNSFKAMFDSFINQLDKINAAVGVSSNHHLAVVGVPTNRLKNLFLLPFLFLPFICMAQSNILTLEEAVKIAIENNYGVVIAKNQIEIGKLNNNWGNAGALPVVSATGNKTLATNSIEQELQNGTSIKRSGASVNNMNAGLAVSWRFYDGMKMFATKKRLEELQKMGEFNFRKMVNETAYDVIVTYYLIVSLKEQTRATNDMIGLYEERLKIADARFTIGTGNKPDVLQAQVDLNEQQSSLLRIDNNINISKTNLNTILARDPAIAFETADSFMLAAPPNFLTLQQKIAQQNPDMMLAQSNLAVLMQSKKEIYSLGLPTATLNTNYNFIRNKSAAGFTLLNQTYGPSASIGISIPIFNGGIAKQQLKVADINIKNQTIAKEQLKNQLLGSFTNAYLNYNNGLKLADMEKKNLLLVKENNFINIERFKKFSITSVELRQGQIYYTDAQARLISAQYQAKIAEAEMLLLAGEIK
jgi:outer membrane protein TolC